MQYINSAHMKATVMVAMMCALFSSVVLADLHIVEMKRFKFIPAELTIKVGDTVRWLNIERRQYHTIWFKGLGEKETQEWFPGESFEKTFDKSGEYSYICGPHIESHDMQGIVRVVE